MRYRSLASRVVFSILVLALAGIVLAAETVPFRGDLEGTVERTPDPNDPSLVFVEVEGTGHASQLGRFAFAAPHYVNSTTRSASGSYEITAANGDTLTADFTGRAVPADAPGVLIITETATITGGTGRFAGATGSFTVERLYDTLTGDTEGSFDGTISSPGSGKR
jgi:hypothetical protein